MSNQTDLLDFLNSPSNQIDINTDADTTLVSENRNMNDVTSSDGGEGASNEDLFDFLSTFTTTASSDPFEEKEESQTHAKTSKASKASTLPPLSPQHNPRALSLPPLSPQPSSTSTRSLNFNNQQKPTQQHEQKQEQNYQDNDNALPSPLPPGTKLTVKVHTSLIGIILHTPNKLSPNIFSSLSASDVGRMGVLPVVSFTASACKKSARVNNAYRDSKVSEFVLKTGDIVTKIHNTRVFTVKDAYTVILGNTTRPVDVEVYRLSPPPKSPSSSPSCSNPFVSGFEVAVNYKSKSIHIPSDKDYKIKWCTLNNVILSENTSSYGDSGEGILYAFYNEQNYIDHVLNKQVTLSSNKISSDCLSNMQTKTAKAKTKEKDNPGSSKPFTIKIKQFNLYNATFLTLFDDGPLSNSVDNSAFKFSIQLYNSNAGGNGVVLHFLGKEACMHLLFFRIKMFMERARPTESR